MSVTLATPDSHLFKCVGTIRTTVDKTDYTDSILLVSSKTISDTSQAPYEAHLREYGDPGIAKRAAPVRNVAS